jgi:hypothetical protein
MNDVGTTELRKFIHSRLKHRFPGAMKQIVSMIGMTLCSLEMIREKCGITHNDPHTSNILCVRTKHDIYEYRFQNGFVKRFRTYGWTPFIIDFGYAYIVGSNIRAPMCQADIGYSVSEHDPFGNARILLNDAAKVISEHSDYAQSDFVKRVRTLFKDLPIQINGWFIDGTFVDVLDELAYICDKGDSSFSDLVGLFIAQLTDPLPKNLCRDDSGFAIALNAIIELNNSNKSIKSSLDSGVVNEQYTKVIDLIRPIVSDICHYNFAQKMDMYNTAQLIDIQTVINTMFDDMTHVDNEMSVLVIE